MIGLKDAIDCVAVKHKKHPELEELCRVYWYYYLLRETLILIKIQLYIG